jgi:hypothetical protein|tara:strand:- start:283 stop:408 length:126 start_codon:yes stop_codon:yes gene_type:complete
MRKQTFVIETAEGLTEDYILNLLRDYADNYKDIHSVNGWTG